MSVKIRRVMVLIKFFWVILLNSLIARHLLIEIMITKSQLSQIIFFIWVNMYLIHVRLFAIPSYHTISSVWIIFKTWNTISIDLIKSRIYLWYMIVRLKPIVRWWFKKRYLLKEGYSWTLFSHINRTFSAICMSIVILSDRV